MIHHNVGEDVGGIEFLNPKGADDTIAASPTSVSVLVAENKAQPIFQNIGGGGLGEKRFGGNEREQALGRAVGNGPPVFPFTERPPAFSGQAVVAAGIG